MTFNRKDLDEFKLKDFEEGLNEGIHNSSVFRFLVPIIIFTIISGLSYSWYYNNYTSKKASSNVEQIPFIRASKEPIRVKPSDPGGMHIPNQDKTVYDVISNVEKENNFPKVTKIMPQPEQPINRNIANNSEQEQVNQVLDEMEKNISDMKETFYARQAGGIIENKTKEDPKLENKSENNKNSEDVKVYFIDSEYGDVDQNRSLEEVKNKESTKTDTKTKSNPKKNISKVITIKNIPIPKIKEKPNNSIKKTNNTSQDKGSMLQLGAFRSISDVEKGWKSLQKRFPKLLSGVEYRTERADLGEKGVFFRLKAGPFSSKSKARSICNQLREKKQGCLFVN